MKAVQFVLIFCFALFLYGTSSAQTEIKRYGVQKSAVEENAGVVSHPVKEVAVPANENERASSVNPTSPDVWGRVVKSDPEAGNFQIAVRNSNGLQMVFFTNGDTVFFVKNAEGMAKGGFSDIQTDRKVFVFYTISDDMTQTVAEQVTVDTQN